MIGRTDAVAGAPRRPCGSAARSPDPRPLTGALGRSRLGDGEAAAGETMWTSHADHGHNAGSGMRARQWPNPVRVVGVELMRRWWR